MHSPTEEAAMPETITATPPQPELVGYAVYDAALNKTVANYAPRALKRASAYAAILDAPCSAHRFKVVPMYRGGRAP
jgi:hypothetical protein